MEPIQGKSLEEIDPFRDEKKNIFIKLAETIIISSYNYLNDFSKFMIGLNSTLLTAYFAILKITKSQITPLSAMPFFLQFLTILFYLAVINPRVLESDINKKPLIYSPERIIEIYQNNINQKIKWTRLGTIFFVFYLISICIVSVIIIDY